MLTLSVSINLGLLFYFKYSNFFVENVNAFLSLFGMTGIHWTKLVLPIGISFYTFETITYVVDVYGRSTNPSGLLGLSALYHPFPQADCRSYYPLPQLADQITDRSANETIDDKLIGFYASQSDWPKR
jgi:alginate O-acetyltransferase complex protein AlgI